MSIWKRSKITGYFQQVGFIEAPMYVKCTKVFSDHSYFLNLPLPFLPTFYVAFENWFSGFSSRIKYKEDIIFSQIKSK